MGSAILLNCRIHSKTPPASRPGQASQPVSQPPNGAHHAARCSDKRRQHRARAAHIQGQLRDFRARVRVICEPLGSMGHRRLRLRYRQTLIAQAWLCRRRLVKLLGLRRMPAGMSACPYRLTESTRRIPRSEVVRRVRVTNLTRRVASSQPSLTRAGRQRGCS